MPSLLPTIVISATIYDKRALTTTDPLALANSLLNLSYMTSVSASRTAAMLEELGSLELLVRVLSRLSVKHDRLSQLAFSAALSCLSNIAVRGTQGLRLRLVSAGIIPAMLPLLLMAATSLSLSSAVLSSLPFHLSFDHSSSTYVHSQLSDPISHPPITTNTDLLTPIQSTSPTPSPDIATDSVLQPDLIRPAVPHHLIHHSLHESLLHTADNGILDINMTDAASGNVLQDTDTVMADTVDSAGSTPFSTTPAAHPILHPLELGTTIPIPPSTHNIDGRLATLQSPPSLMSLDTAIPIIWTAGDTAAPIHPPHDTPEVLSSLSNETLVESRSHSGTDVPDVGYAPLISQSTPPAAYSPLILLPTHDEEAQSTPDTATTNIAHMPDQGNPHDHNIVQSSISPQETGGHPQTLSDLPISTDLRSDDLLLATKLIAYVSKYFDVRQTLHSAYQINIYAVIEGLTSTNIQPDLRKWAIICMRSCFKRNGDSGSLRRCSNLKCSNVESFLHEFSKCSRCRRVTYCWYVV
ncbi:hypothetical protein BASA83_003149 [Batrachochytrium salamandrivorans]|nr:hypothetical protein BASA62_009778 [Batrachochytrium salamandrivorans]KAH9274513.1 hypothetical protein BASA83_003149 [Batrachochytrium salamandrivorans]